MSRTLTAWGLCGSCRRTRKLSADGTLRNHNAYVPSLVGEWSPLGGTMRLCDGSGKPGTADRNIQTVKPGDVL